MLAAFWQCEMIKSRMTVNVILCVQQKEKKGKGKGKGKRKRTKGLSSRPGRRPPVPIVVAVPFVFGQDVHDQHWRQRLCRGNVFQCLNDVRFAVGRFFHTHGGIVRQNFSPQVAVTVAYSTVESNREQLRKVVLVVVVVAIHVAVAAAQQCK